MWRGVTRSSVMWVHPYLVGSRFVTNMVLIIIFRICVPEI